MALAVMVSGDSPHLSGFQPQLGESYELKLKQSVEALLAENEKEDPNFSTFLDLFHRFTHAEVDPPVESIWVYCALKFRSRDSPKGEILERLSAVKDLFQLVSSCSASSGYFRGIVLLSAVVYELHKIAVELFGRDLSVKGEKKAIRELRSLVDIILGCISVGSCKQSDEVCDAASMNSILPFRELVAVWTGSNEGAECFFPLLSHGVYDWLSVREFDNRCLAGVVILEAFLLKLCLYFRLGKQRHQLEKEMKHWAVGSIYGFQNFPFYEALLRLMLDATLPLSSLLKPDHEVLMRKALFDSLVLVDYPFLHLERANHLHSEQNECLVIERLIVTLKATEHFRSCNDHNRLIAYLKAFSLSPVPSGVFKWVASLISLDEQSFKPKGSSPKALIEWLVNLEDKGLKVFNDETLRCHAQMDVEMQSEAGLVGKMVDDELLFFVDTKGDDGHREEEVKRNEMMSAAFIDAANVIKTTESGKKKRKVGKSDKRKKKIKFVKYDLSEDSNAVSVRASVDANSVSSEGNEVEKSPSEVETDSTD